MNLIFCRISAIGLLLLGSLTDALACSCVAGVSTKEHVTNATYVFIGKVVDTAEVLARPDMPEREGVVAQIQSGEILKGRRINPYRIVTGRGSGDCGVPMLVGQSYIFMAGTSQSVDICSGTRPYVQGNKASEAYLKQVKSLVPRKSN